MEYSIEHSILELLMLQLGRLTTLKDNLKLQKHF